MGADDARIKDYIDRHAALNFQGQTFETSKILYIVATANGEPLLWVNERLQRSARDMEYALNDVQVVPAYFMAIAKERYQKDLQNIVESANMKLTMADIQYIVEEATKRLMQL
jgi:chromosomal replication initiation ATPase DnaA